MLPLLKRGLPAATILLALAPAAGQAETVTVDPVRVASQIVHFEIGGVEPRQIMSGRVVAGGHSRALKRSSLQRAARTGTLKVSRAAFRARTARRSSLRETKLVLFVDTLPPTAPASVSVQAAQRAVVSWSRSKDDFRLAGYQVFRGEKRVKVTSRTKFTDALGGAGDYKVRAVDAAGNVSAFSMPPTSPLAATSTPGGGASWKCGWGTFDLDRLPGECWRPFADDSFINTPLPADAKLLDGNPAKSKAMIDRIIGMGKIPYLQLTPEKGEDWYHPYFFSRPTDPEYRVVCNKNAHDCPVENMKLRIPVNARGADSTDGHMTVIDQTTGWEWDFWNVQTDVLPAGGGDIVVGWGGRTRIDGQGGGTRETESPATMAALGSTAGIIRYPEIAAGRIDHALFLVVGCSSGEMVFPGRDYGGFCDDKTNAPASGQWLRLNMSHAEIGALPVDDWQKTILRALATYGGFVGDVGGNESIGFHIDSPATYEAVGKENPWIGWAKDQISAGAKHVETWRDYEGVRRYGLNAGGLRELWQSRLEVVDPCVIKRTC